MSRSFTAEVVNDLNVATDPYILPMVSQLNVDNVVHARLAKKSKPLDGGKKISSPMRVRFEKAGSVTKYQSYDTQVKDILEMAEFDWKFVRGEMNISKVDVEVINAGKEARLNIAESRILNMKDSMGAQFSELLFKAVADRATKDPESLYSMCATQNNTVGGIDASVCLGGSGTITEDYTWNPYLLDLSDQSMTRAKLLNSNDDYYIRKILRKLVDNLTMGNDEPTILLGSPALWSVYEEDLMNFKQIDANRMEIDGGFKALSFRGIPFVKDANCPGGLINTTDNDTSGVLFGLNENYLQFYHSSKYGTSNVGMGMRWVPWKELETEPVLHSRVEWAGALTCSNRQRQGAVIGLPSDTALNAA